MNELNQLQYEFKKYGVFYNEGINDLRNKKIYPEKKPSKDFFLDTNDKIKRINQNEEKFN